MLSFGLPPVQQFLEVRSLEEGWSGLVALDEGSLASDDQLALWVVVWMLDVDYRFVSLGDLDLSLCIFLELWWIVLMLRFRFRLHLGFRWLLVLLNHLLLNWPILAITYLSHLINNITQHTDISQTITPWSSRPLH